MGLWKQYLVTYYFKYDAEPRHVFERVISACDPQHAERLSRSNWYGLLLIMMIGVIHGKMIAVCNLFNSSTQK